MRFKPAFVMYGNLGRGSKGGFPAEGGAAVLLDGRRRDLALGRERKDGHVCVFGGPVRAKIWDIHGKGF